MDSADLPKPGFLSCKTYIRSRHQHILELDPDKTGCEDEQPMSKLSLELSQHLVQWIGTLIVNAPLLRGLYPHSCKIDHFSKQPAWKDAHIGQWNIELKSCMAPPSPTFVSDFIWNRFFGGMGQLNFCFSSLEQAVCEKCFPQHHPPGWDLNHRCPKNFGRS